MRAGRETYGERHRNEGEREDSNFFINGRERKLRKKRETLGG